MKRALILCSMLLLFGGLLMAEPEASGLESDGGGTPAAKPAAAPADGGNAAPNGEKAPAGKEG